MNKNIDYTALGKRIKEKRIENGLTQEQLGELCELSAAHIGHIERGTRILSVEVLFRIAQVLNVSVDYLLFDSVENDNILNSIAPILKDTDKNKVNHFLNTVRVLAENIDEL
ncbi:helix-turn-helix domain-containing protein [Ruminococcus sp.]|jgi:transcriptional regulator with XRE-family HTH domain|uniref:helix-turn-helix domain-containing protein n=1 Tax=Ruminococcus sp. TaxID=41978 RepID=UPI003F81B319